MSALRSQTDEQLAARWDDLPWRAEFNTHIQRARYATEPAARLSYGSAVFDARVECVPSRDPLPYVEFDGKTHHSHVPGVNYGTGARCCRFEPRPEFARPPVNGILSWVRSRQIAGESFATILWRINNGGTSGTHEEYAHARAVLGKLVAVAA